MTKKIIESECGNTIILAGDEVPVDFNVSDSAKTRIEELCKNEDPGSFLRVAVMGGGCAGFQYMFGFDDILEESDIVNDWGNGKVAVDEMSIDFMKGSTINFVSDFGGDYFQVENPLAQSNCGCGNSFAPEESRL